MEIDLARLDLGKKLGDGTQGRVFEAAVKKSGSFQFPLVYKEFLPEIQASAHVLASLSGFRDRASLTKRSFIDGHTAWPLAIVKRDASTVHGYLMQRIPREFMIPLSTQSGRKSKTAEIQLLIKKDTTFAQDHGFTISLTQRLQLAIALASIYEFLHSNSYVYGDLNWRNALWTLHPKPSVFLIDCDGLRKGGNAAAVDQLHSPGWTPAGASRAQSVETDRYKLALAILRFLSPGLKGQCQGTKVADFNQISKYCRKETVDLLKRALMPGIQKADCPTPQAWLTCLNVDLSQTRPNPRPVSDPTFTKQGSGVKAHPAQPPAAPIPPGPSLTSRPLPYPQVGTPGFRGVPPSSATGPLVQQNPPSAPPLTSSQPPSSQARGGLTASCVGLFTGAVGGLLAIVMMVSWIGGEAARSGGGRASTSSPSPVVAPVTSQARPVAGAPAAPQSKIDPAVSQPAKTETSGGRNSVSDSAVITFDTPQKSQNLFQYSPDTHAIPESVPIDELHILRNHAGKKIEARILSVDNDRVTLIKEGDQTIYAYPVANLDEKSQRLIADLRPSLPMNPREKSTDGSVFVGPMSLKNGQMFTNASVRLLASTTAIVTSDSGTKIVNISQLPGWLQNGLQKTRVLVK